LRYLNFVEGDEHLMKNKFFENLTKTMHQNNNSLLGCIISSQLFGPNPDAGVRVLSQCGVVYDDEVREVKVILRMVHHSPFMHQNLYTL